MKLTRIVLNSGAPVTRECAIGVPDKGNQEPQQIRVAKLKAERNFCGYTLLIADSTVGFILSGTKNDFLLLHLHPRDPVVYSVRTEKPLAAAPGFCDYTPGNPFDAVIGGYKMAPHNQLKVRAEMRQSKVNVAPGSPPGGLCESNRGAPI